MQNEKDTKNDGNNTFFQKMQSAVEKADYDQLSELITSSAENIINRIGKGIKSGEYEVKKAIKAAKVQASNQTPFSNSKPSKKKLPAPIAKNPVGTFSAPLMTVGAGAAVISAGAMAFSALAAGINFGLLTLSGVFLAIGAALFIKSKSVFNRLGRFKKYVGTIDGKHYINTDALADASGKTEKYVIKDIQKMIDDEMFPEGKFSDDRKTLILSNEAYDEYLKLEKGKRLKAEEEARLKELEAKNPIYAEIHRIRREGEQNLTEIRQIKHHFSDQEMIEKLDRLENVVERIFDYIETHPSQISEIRHFMDYYLPVTLKLVRSYDEMNAQPVQGETILKSKQEIRDALNTINASFEKLLDSLYESTAMDISGDIFAMKTMMAREGLTEEQQ